MVKVISPSVKCANLVCPPYWRYDDIERVKELEIGILCCGCDCGCDCVGWDIAESLASASAPGSLYNLDICTSYLWSPLLVPKPRDWGKNIQVVGFSTVLLSDLVKYKPPEDLLTFMEAGGSSVLDS